MARLSEGSLTKEKMTQKLHQLLLPQALAAARPKMPVVLGGTVGHCVWGVGPSCRPRSHGHLQARPGLPVQVSHPFFMGRSWEGLCP